MTTRDTLGCRLKAHRIRIGATQADLAKSAGVSQSFVSQLESDVFADPSIRAVCSIERALGIGHGALTAGLFHKRSRRKAV